MVVITSLGAGYCGEEILHLYRSRWQVELLFKRFKQNFSVTSLKAGNTDYAETEVILWLIIWAIPEQQLFLAECFLAGKEETVNCSVYEKCKVSLLQIKEILCLPWGQFLNFTDKKYSRYLSRKNSTEKIRMMSSIQQFYQDCLLKFTLMCDYPLSSHTTYPDFFIILKYLA